MDDFSKPDYNIDEIKKFIIDNYGFEGDIKALPGEKDQNYKIEGSNQSFKLKISNYSEKKEFLELQNNILIHLKNDFFNSPEVVKSNNGDYITSISHNDITNYIRLVTYLPGKVLANIKPHNDNLFLGFGRFIAQLTQLLKDFNHPAANRYYKWDLINGSEIINNYIGDIVDEKIRDIVSYYNNEFLKIKEDILQLNKSIIHNDCNDYNVIINMIDVDNYMFGLIDFGDVIQSITLFELAIGIAYIILNKKDPLLVAMRVVKGYNEIIKLNDNELKILYILIAMRLCVSVGISSHNMTSHPENEYLLISQQPAINALIKLRQIHNRFAYYCFRGVCGYIPIPHYNEIITLINNINPTTIFGSEIDANQFRIIDLSISSLSIKNPDQINTNEKLALLIENKLQHTEFKSLLGRYLEPRLIYQCDDFKTGNNDWRTIHLGIDLFVHTSIYAPLDGIIHSFNNNSGTNDYGPTIILEHKIYNFVIYTLYGHLSPSSLDGLKIGKIIKQGDWLGEIGEYDINGNWPPHLHFEIILDLFDHHGEFPGVIHNNYLDIWKYICPNPNILLKWERSDIEFEILDVDQLIKQRGMHISNALSIAYSKHLNIVRGYNQYLYDQYGRRYLDAVNNVPHVGHSNPRVVDAMLKQAFVLNTNTRYLHQNIINYAEKLCSKLPDGLDYCFFVNSGSEANELALRLARTYTNAEDFVVLDAAYHGNTNTLINISPYKFNGPGGKGKPENIHIVSLPDTFRGKYRDENAGIEYANEVKNICNNFVDKKLAGMIVESLPGVGGQIVLPRDYLINVFNHVRAAGGVCIIDEVQIGFGRVGTHFWGFQIYDPVVPDIITMGKPIGNGFPLAAVITTREIATSFDNGMEYFNTTGGNPVSCAVGMAVLTEIETNQLQQNALTVGNYLKAGLVDLMHKYSIIGDVRGVELFIGIELIKNRPELTPAADYATYIVERMKDNGILLSTDGPYHNIIKIKPPLVFNKANADELISNLEKILNEEYLILQKSDI